MCKYGPYPVRMGLLLSLWGRWVPRVTPGYSGLLSVFRLLVPAAVDGPQIASAAVRAEDDSGIPAFRSVGTSLSAVSTGGPDIDRFSQGSGSVTLAPCSVLLNGAVKFILRARHLRLGWQCIIGFTRAGDRMRSRRLAATLWPRSGLLLALRR